ncbi:tripartite tricarboxylate transporter permease [Egibacter rhizosphaerae]|uniref:Tripartite tricarboxylate transporter permease n=1 Tax=Egibacter rhizosphaerae TaxID=1670831 RepID=A0A411YBH8_9ACTN|nr:tripartite tricarboxylate transporter permease [Egibacter rhizosphaerae]QBI18564.1 tripartite tricarboxylate transporter permease [Egibacter rhizosphaerae]
MDTLTLVIEGFQTAVSPENLLFCLLGVMLGTVIGMMPGLGSATGVAILLPATVALEPVTALIMLAGIYYGCQYGATISAVLIATPGDPASVVTMFDGYPMAQAGKAAKALAAAAIASFIAGTISIVLLMAAAPAFLTIALQFGAPEMTSLILLGMLSVAGFTAKNPFKGLSMGALGLAIATVGIDSQSGVGRFTFDQIELFGGFGFIEIVIGLFAIAEVMRQVGRGGARPIKTRFRDMKLTRQEFAETAKPAIRQGFLGFFIGALPGAGATLAAFFGYETERRLSKRPERFGRGEISGVAGPEGANNAATNGAFVPTLTLGIPGSGTTAILLGAFLIFGLRPGPLLMVEQPDLAWGLMASFWIGNLFLLALNLPLAPAFASILRIPYKYLFPVIVMLALLGAFAIENRMWGVWIACAFGLLGYLMNRYGFPPAPLILGLVLGPEMESQLSRSLSISWGDPMIFLARPISAVLLALGFVLLLAPTVTRVIRSRVRWRAGENVPVGR